MDPRNQPSLLERIYSWENLLDAYHEAASEKWYRNDVTAFAANLEENLISIQNDLIWHTYKVGKEPPEQPTGFNTGARSWIGSRANGTT